jgi:hypothetical protein
MLKKLRPGCKVNYTEGGKYQNIQPLSQKKKERYPP